MSSVVQEKTTFTKAKAKANAKKEVATKKKKQSESDNEFGSSSEDNEDKKKVSPRKSFQEPKVPSSPAIKPSEPPITKEDARAAYQKFLPKKKDQFKKNFIGDQVVVEKDANEEGDVEDKSKPGKKKN